MSTTILALAKSFSKERLTADEFANAYMELWRFERDCNLLQEDEDNLSECLSSIFCLADLFNPDVDREEYELDEKQLRDKVIELIEKFKV
ncbi:colicin immunity domain-containing protein [Microbulbifer spongiae]|uniref:Colicin immunity domain-containing protein n=1 Tax=Microbulbifer spongiae TaxID=2944933 RepID=A0ABY9ED65_9GAMM|nr:colicin immunity domain-containing protein [Microbulbifer sp. MI-G]WKD50592.1 colicin immunity domain-containing protein [Microbulbifer sp. MI-G]